MIKTQAKIEPAQPFGTTSNPQQMTLNFPISFPLYIFVRGRLTPEDSVIPSLR